MSLISLIHSCLTREPTLLRPSNYAVKLLGSEPLSTLLRVSPHICADPSPRIYQGEFQLTACVTWITGTCIPPALLSGNSPFQLSAGWCPQEAPQRSSSLSTWSFYASYPCFCRHWPQRTLCPSLVCFTPRGDLPFPSNLQQGMGQVELWNFTPASEWWQRGSTQRKESGP